MWAQIFARVIWPRIGAAAELEGAHPARFAQFIGFVVAAPALLGFVVGVDALGLALTAVAVAGAGIHADAGVCLGCKIYLLARRLRRARA